MARLLLLILLTISALNNASAQFIKLEEVWINCDTIIKHDSVQFEPYELSFVFSAKNETDKELCIGANYFPGMDEDLKFGYFELKIDSTKLFKLKSKYSSIPIPSNNSIPMYVALFEDIFFEQHLSLSELYNIVINIEEDSYSENNCKNTTEADYSSDQSYDDNCTDFLKHSFVRQFKTLSELFDSIIKSEISYYSIKDDYKEETCCGGIFPSQQIIKNEFSIILASDGEGLREYRVKR